MHNLERNTSQIGGRHLPQSDQTKVLVTILLFMFVIGLCFFQCIKALSRNTVTATLLGREGIIAVISEVISKLAESSFGPKLKVAAEVLSALTKSSKFYFIRNLGINKPGCSLNKHCFEHREVS